MPYNILGKIGQLTMFNGCTCENPCVILTMDNILQFCDNIQLPENFDTSKTIAALPKDFLPVNTSYVPITCDNNGSGAGLGMLGIRSTGEIVVLLTKNKRLFTRGVTVSFAGNYYTNEIGNNKAQGTSPLDEV